MKQKQLSEEVNKDEKALAKKKESLLDVENKIAKFKSGDWSVLQQFAKGKQPDSAIPKPKEDE